MPVAAGIWFVLQSICSALQVFDLSFKVFDQLCRYLMPVENIGGNLRFTNVGSIFFETIGL